MDRKRRESGVRAVLKGKHVVTAEDVYEQAPNTEEATREKRARKARKSTSTIQFTTKRGGY